MKPESKKYKVGYSVKCKHCGKKIEFYPIIISTGFPNWPKGSYHEDCAKLYDKT